LAAAVPAIGVFLFETIRHTLLENQLPMLYGNVLTGLLALTLGYVFAEALFRTIVRVQSQAVSRSQELTALRSIVQERERLSRELHDGLAQVVSYLLLRLDTVEGLVRAGRGEEAATELAALRAVTDDLYSDVRESISGLRSRVVELGLVRAMQEYVDEFEERHGVSVTLDAGELGKLPPSVELQVFRIAQEALANVRKHSGARHAQITLGLGQPNRLRLMIRDDGKGFEVDAASKQRHGSFGLRGMRERAESLGGTCHVESRPGHGTSVVIKIPIGAEAKRTYEAVAAAAG
jgi:signal transduction histidine kinase